MPETTTEAAPHNPYQDDNDEQVREGWSIESMDVADWALQRIASMKAMRDENEYVAEATVLKINARTEKLNERLDNGIRFFQGQLQAYAEANRSTLLKGGKAKSRALPSGSLGWKTVPAKLAVEDEAAAAAWATAQPVSAELVRYKTELNKISLANHFKETGEVPPGCTVTPEREDFVVKTESAAKEH